MTENIDDGSMIDMENKYEFKCVPASLPDFSLTKNKILKSGKMTICRVKVTELMGYFSPIKPFLFSENRNIDQSHIENLLKKSIKSFKEDKYIPITCGQISLAKLGTEIKIIDGQHRLNVLNLLISDYIEINEFLKTQKILIRIYNATDFEDMKNHFNEINTNHLPVPKMFHDEDLKNIIVNLAFKITNLYDPSFFKTTSPQRPHINIEHLKTHCSESKEFRSIIEYFCGETSTDDKDKINEIVTEELFNIVQLYNSFLKDQDIVFFKSFQMKWNDSERIKIADASKKCVVKALNGNVLYLGLIQKNVWVEKAIEYYLATRKT